MKDMPQSDRGEAMPRPQLTSPDVSFDTPSALFTPADVRGGGEGVVWGGEVVTCEMRHHAQRINMIDYAYIRQTRCESERERVGRADGGRRYIGLVVG